MSGAAADPHEPYIRAWRERFAKAEAERARRYAEARAAASRAAKVLLAAGAKRVRLFGSLTSERRFHDRSDIDLSPEGIDPGRIDGALLMKLDEAARPFVVDVRPLEEAGPYLSRTILSLGEEIS